MSDKQKECWCDPETPGVNPSCPTHSAQSELAAPAGSETQAITAMVGPAGQVMMVQAQGKVLLLEREEAMELYEAIKTNLGKMSVQI